MTTKPQTFWCVSSKYKAGGNVTRDLYKIDCVSKPVDSEKETDFCTIVRKYFDNEDDAIRYKDSIAV